MRLENLDISNRNEIVFVENLYIESFPISERRSVNAMLDLYENHPAFTISLVIKANQYVGFLTYWDLGDFIFAEHFAISPEFRNGGYGGKVMNLFIQNMSKPIILEVELPATILSERRIGFYQRLNFKLWEHIAYQQPPYLKDSNPIPMKLMTYGNIDLDKDLQDIRDKIYSIVYNIDQ